MICKVVFAANAGVVICLRGKNIWVDLPFLHGAAGFSSASPETEEHLIKTFPPDILVFTHDHPDHFSQSKLAKVLSQFPYAQVVMPQAQENQADCGDISVSRFSLQHSGTQYRDTPHYGILLSDGNCRLFLLGDCDVATKELPLLWKQFSPDALFVPFPWLTITRGQKMLCQDFKPKHLFVYHLPCSADDVNGFLSMTQDKARQLLLPDVRILSNPLQTEFFDYS